MYSLIIIDDEFKIREGLINLFPWSNIGFKIVGEFSNGKQALEFLQHNHVDVILTDIKMPVMSGIELSHILSEQNCKSKLVFLTGYQDFEYMQAAIINRAYDYLLKPIKYEELVICFERIKDLLDTENNMEQSTDPIDDQNNSYYENIIKTVCSYIDTNFKNATLKEASILVSLSPNYLSKIFKENFGITFSAYLFEVRMKKAAELLQDIHYKHYEIAYYLGYDNPKNFSRAFKQYYNVTPSEFREQK